MNSNPLHEPADPMSKLLDALRERAKELNCLYNIEELIRDYDKPLDEVFLGVIEAIPPGWRYPHACLARILYLDKVYKSPRFLVTSWRLSAPIEVQGQRLGAVEVFYIEDMPTADQGPFLTEEVRLIKTIAERLGDFIQHQNLRQTMQAIREARSPQAVRETPKWRIAVNLARRMDPNLYTRIARKMLNYLCWNGVKEAGALLKRLGSDRSAQIVEISEGMNRPQARRTSEEMALLCNDIFETADRALPDEEILSCVQKWMQEDRASFLIKTLETYTSSLGDIADGLRRYMHLSAEGIRLSDPSLKGIRVALIRRIISDHLEYIKVAKNYVEIEDFTELMQRIIYPRGSHGLLGGKSAGLFLANQIIRHKCAQYPELKGIKVPRTWYITSDGILSFMDQNNLEEVTEQKYKDVEIVRQEYPHIIQLFKNSQFKPEIIQGLSSALDELGDKPVIVRSSSLLEDRLGAAFSGKYKSLFLANQGTKEQRLEALMDAIAEVYSSTFGSDPIEYRSERDLIDFYEEMAVIIQEVVGVKVGDYFMPAFAGVAFSNNEFRWSSRIKRDDGLIRLVPGLGTRAVDRLSDDYPILIAPGQPGLRVNISVEDMVRYSPNKMDVINLKSNSFETVDVLSFFREYGEQFPLFDKIISVILQDHIKAPQWDLDLETDTVAVTFEGLLTGTPFVQQVNTLLKILQDTLGSPVDIEFAHDGASFYLLQCRPQSFTADAAPSVIPKDVAESSVVFTARKYVSNGQVPDITHIVYVDSFQYNELTDLNVLVDVGRAVSKLNQSLPRRQFILMGPGRWGSRGDIKLGVQVTYSDINNTAVLIEIARQKGNYVPDLSFGTHFFQDLVEASIRYLPLYPDDENIIFNERFLLESPSIFNDLLPEYKYLDKVVRVIDVKAAAGGKILRILMNAELDEAMGLLTQPAGRPEVAAHTFAPLLHPVSEDHWRWRYRMVEHIAENLDADRFGVKALYLFGSAKNATSHPGSDIDIMIHFHGDAQQMMELLAWLEGWSLSLDEMNYLRTGYRTGGLLDVHIITDQDIKQRSSYAAKIGAVTDPALEIPLKRSVLKMDAEE